MKKNQTIRKEILLTSEIRWERKTGMKFGYVTFTPNLKICINSWTKSDNRKSICMSVCEHDNSKP